MTAIGGKNAKATLWQTVQTLVRQGDALRAKAKQLDPAAKLGPVERLQRAAAQLKSVQAGGTPTAQARSPQSGSGLPPLETIIPLEPHLYSIYQQHDRILPSLGTSTTHAPLVDAFMGILRDMQTTDDVDTAIATRWTAIMTAAAAEFAAPRDINQLGAPTAAHVALAAVAQLSGDELVVHRLYTIVSVLAAQPDAAGRATRIALGAAIAYGTPGAAAARVILSDLTQPWRAHTAAVRLHARALHTRTAARFDTVLPHPHEPAFAPFVYSLYNQCRDNPDAPAVNALRTLVTLAATTWPDTTGAAHIALTKLVMHMGADGFATLVECVQRSTHPHCATAVCVALGHTRTELLKQQQDWQTTSFMGKRGGIVAQAIAQQAAIIASTQLVPRAHISDALDHITEAYADWAWSSNEKAASAVAAALLITKLSAEFTTEALTSGKSQLQWLAQIFWPTGRATRHARAALALELRNADDIRACLKNATSLTLPPIISLTIALPLLDHAISTQADSMLDEVCTHVVQGLFDSTETNGNYERSLYLLHRLSVARPGIVVGLLQSLALGTMPKSIALATAVTAPVQMRALTALADIARMQQNDSADRAAAINSLDRLHHVFSANQTQKTNRAFVLLATHTARQVKKLQKLLDPFITETLRKLSASDQPAAAPPQPVAPPVRLPPQPVRKPKKSKPTAIEPPQMPNTAVTVAAAPKPPAPPRPTPTTVVIEEPPPLPDDAFDRAPEPVTLPPAPAPIAPQPPTPAAPEPVPPVRIPATPLQPAAAPDQPAVTGKTNNITIDDDDWAI